MRLIISVITSLTDVLLDVREKMFQPQNVVIAHSQMSAEIFRGLIRYTWHASGYVDSHPGVFKTVDKVCFDINTDSCQVTNCDQSPFIRCSWCNKIILHISM